jgi:hypothetical protein
MSRLLADISRDPALLQWLHNRSRRVFISDESLKAAACTIKASAALPSDVNYRHPSQKNSPDLLPGPSFAQGLVNKTLAPSETEDVGLELDEPGGAPPVVGQDNEPPCNESQSISSARDPRGTVKTTDKICCDQFPPEKFPSPAAPTPVVPGITSDSDAAAKDVATVREESFLESKPVAPTTTETAGSWDCTSVEQRQERATSTPVAPVHDSVHLENVDLLAYSGRVGESSGIYDAVAPSPRAIPENVPIHGSVQEMSDGISGSAARLVAESETEQNQESNPEPCPPSEHKQHVALLDDSEVPCDLTETLYIPVFRTDHFVLGELHSNFSTNSKILMLATQRQTGFSTIARRFVANLFIEDCIEYVEYEWFEGGYLVVAVHTYSFDGSYTARYVVFGHLNSKSGTTIPSRVLMTLNYSELEDCPTCLERDLLCTCEDPIRWYHLPTKKTITWSWSQWITGLYRVQAESGTGHINLALATPQGDLCQDFPLRVSRKGITQDVKITKGRLLSFEYAALLSVDNMYPTMDCQLVDGTDGGRVASVSDASFSAEIIDTSSSGANAKISEMATTGPGLYSSSVTSRDGVAGAVRGDWPPDLGSGRPGGHGDHSSNLGGSEAHQNVSAISKRYFCACGHLFTHRGHYNAHLRAVHMKCVFKLVLLIFFCREHYLSLLTVCLG